MNYVSSIFMIMYDDFHLMSEDEEWYEGLESNDEGSEMNEAVNSFGNIRHN